MVIISKQSYDDGQYRGPLVLLPDPLFQLRMLPFRLLDEVSVAEPRHLGLRVGVDVRLKDQDGRIRLLQLRLGSNKSTGFIQSTIAILDLVTSA